jgi:hypothetical protein
MLDIRVIKFQDNSGKGTFDLADYYFLKQGLTWYDSIISRLNILEFDYQASEEQNNSKINIKKSLVINLKISLLKTSKKLKNIIYIY